MSTILTNVAILAENLF